MVLIDPKDAEKVYNESGAAGRRKGKIEVVYLEHWTETEVRIMVDNVLRLRYGTARLKAHTRSANVRHLHAAHSQSFLG